MLGPPSLPVRSAHPYTAVLLCILAVLTTQVQGSEADTSAYRHIQNSGTLNYLLHLPTDYEESGDNFPLLLFLHGIGQKGNGSEHAISKVATDGPFRSMQDALWDDSLPLIVIGPQSGGVQPWWRGSEVEKILTHALDAYRVDPDRIYLTGISMGGRSSWWLANNHSHRIAAMVPTSAWAGNLKQSCSRFQHMGIWSFHGSKDPLIRPDAGRKPVTTLGDCSPSLTTPPKLTLLDGIGHGDWHMVYANQHGDSNTGGDGDSYSDIYRWLLSFSSRKN